MNGPIGSMAGSPNKPLPVGARIFVGVLIIGLLWLWIGFSRFRPDELRDFANRHGKLISAEESMSIHNFQKAGHLDIRLQESSVRYCVPEDGYTDLFRRKAFFAEVPQGSSIQ